MAYNITGNDAINRAGALGGGATFIDVVNPITHTGILKLWSCYIATGIGGTGKIKIFRDDGVNYLFIGETGIMAVAGGLNTDLPVWLYVMGGDLIGFYSVDADIDTGGTSNQTKSKAGDITGDSAKAGWENQNGPMSLNGKIFTRVAPL